MMQHDYPEDWVLATGVTKTVRDFAEEAFACKFELGRLCHYLRKMFRPNEVDYLLGDSSKAREVLIKAGV